MSKVKSERSIGLDIGFRHIKAIELLHNNQGFQITKFAIREIPSEVLRQKVRTESLGKIIKDMFSETKIRGSSVYLSITGHNVIIRNVLLPKMPTEELLDAAKRNAKEDVLFDLEKAVIDNYIMGETQKDGVILLDVMSVIVSGDVIEFITAIIKTAGLKPKGATVVPLALWDYDQAIKLQESGVVTIYADMGAERTRIYFISNGCILFSREIPNGGNNLTKCLVGEYELEGGKTAIINEERAEQIKKTFGYPAKASNKKTEEGLPLKLIRQRMEPVLMKQAAEMRRSIEYFKSQYRRDLVDRLTLSGGGMSLHGLYEFLKEHLDLKINRCNVFTQTTVRDDSVSKENMEMLGPSLTVAAGLALGKCNKINVLPEKYRPSLKKSLTKLAPLVTVFVLFIAVYGYSSISRHEVFNEKFFLKEQKSNLEKLQLQLPELQKFIGELAEGKETKKFLYEENIQLPGSSLFRFSFDLIFSKISQLIADNTSFTQASYTKRDNKKESGEVGLIQTGDGDIISREKVTSIANN